MTTQIRPCLMFQGEAEAAMTLYTSLLPDSEVLSIARYGPEGPGAEGSVVQAVFRLGEQTVLCLDSSVPHDFTFTPAFSFFVDCESEAELRRLAEALGEGGGVMMPLGNYGFSQLFTWFADRFGVSWQLNLP